VAAVWGRLREDGQDWPTEEQWVLLREADRLDRLEPDRTVTADASGVVTVGCDLPMPAMSLVTLTPA
jgi:xylan 1,4-beta-xylosidase